MVSVPTVRLNDGIEIPQVGLGVGQIPDDATSAVVQTALSAGYRAVDTAAVYHNETGVGAGLRGNGIPVEDVFVTTKLWNDCCPGDPRRCVRFPAQGTQALGRCAPRTGTDRLIRRPTTMKPTSTTRSPGMGTSWRRATSVAPSPRSRPAKAPRKGRRLTGGAMPVQRASITRNPRNAQAGTENARPKSIPRMSRDFDGRSEQRGGREAVACS